MLQLLCYFLQQTCLRLSVMLLALLVSSCANAPVVAPISEQQLPQTSELGFITDQVIPTTADFYQLTSAQQQHFLQFFHAPDQAEVLPHKRLYLYLEHHLSNFNYEGKNTLASATMTQMSGNCVSLALLVTALAQLVDIEVGYRATYAEPMLDYSSNILLSSAHVRSYLFEKNPPKDKSMMYLQRSAIVIDYFPGPLTHLGALLQKNQFEAMIYNNLAADALLAGNLSQAYWLSKAALQRDPGFSPSINLIAILYRRSGDLAASAQWYEFGSRYSAQQVNLLSNYLVLAEQMQNQPLITRLKSQLKSVDDDNPFAWFYLAMQAEQDKQPAEAVFYYRKLLVQAPYLHKANLALARLQFQLGNTASARRALHDALEYSHEPTTRKLYQAKLQALEKFANPPNSTNEL